ncbi:MAG: hypothetical protein KAQ67_11030 [Gammaproteobacteria bacterium]|nr:hypothetical protein [Gammaproteobacteria bacterium]
MRLTALVLICLPVLSQADDFSFNLSNYQKKDYEWTAIFELTSEHLQLDQSNSLYNLNFPDGSDIDTLNRYTGSLVLEGLYRFKVSSLHFRGLLENQDDQLGSQHQSTIQQLYYAYKSSDKLSYEFGKRVLKWGKGYAWNPVAFAERAKDPNDPDLNREGYILLTGDYTKSFTNNDLKTISITPFILPVDNDLNDDFGKEEDINLGAKIYMLYRDVDIDFMFMRGNTRGDRIGADFSSNLTANFEWHGELAYLADQPINTINSSNQLVQNKEDVVQGLIGIRYLTESDLTWILEYYHNDAGYDNDELEQFYNLASSDPVTQATLFTLAKNAQAAGFGKPNPGRDYAYIRVSKKDFFDIVYLAGSLTSIVNINDSSYSFMPELIYTGVKNMEIRARIIWLQGDDGTEFGEKMSDTKLEFRFQYFI